MNPVDTLSTYLCRLLPFKKGTYYVASNEKETRLYSLPLKSNFDAKKVNLV